MIVQLQDYLSCALALLAGGAALFWSGDGSVPSGSFISQAEARIGRPATPMSYAGVARRTTRRGVAYGAAAGAAAAGHLLLRRLQAASRL